MHGKHKHSKSEVAITTHDTGTPNRWLLPVLLVAQLMVILDITAVNIALPHIATDLNLSGSSISWTITSYSLIFGSLLLFGGRASDLLGRRRMFLTGLVIFTSASFMSAMATSATTLFTARAGQGVGAALLSPAALSIITAGFHGEARAKAQAAWGAVGGAGAAIGVLVGGILTQATDWRTIFYVNIPVAAVLLVASLKLVPADTQKPRWRGLDLPGAALATTSLAAIVYGITQANSAGWTSVQTHLCGLGGVAGLIAFAVYERHTDRPLLRVGRMADRAVGGGLALQLVAAGSIFGLFLLCSLYLQNVLGWGPLNTGLAFIPLAVAAGVGAHLSGHAISKHGVRAPLAGAFAIAAIGMFLLSRVGPSGSYLADILPGHADRRPGSRRRGRDRLDVGACRRSQRGSGDDLGTLLDRSRDRWHPRHRDLLHDRRRRERSNPRPSDGNGNRARVLDRRARRYARQRCRTCPTPSRPPLPRQAAAEPAGNARPLSDDRNEDQDQCVRPETPGGRRAQHRGHRQRRPRSSRQ